MTDTHDDFERHFKPTIRQQKRHMNGDYRDPDIQAKWLGWQAAQGACIQEVWEAMRGGKAPSKADVIGILQDWHAIVTRADEYPD